MSHYYDQGFCVRRPSWHRQENLLQDYPEDWSAARVLAGLDWEPEEDALYRMLSLQVGDELPMGSIPTNPNGVEVRDGLVVCTVDQPVMARLDNYKAILNDQTRDVLSVVGSTWSPIYHRQMGELLATAKQTDSALKFDSVGSAGGGRRVWAVAYLDEPYTIPGDDSETYPYLVVLNAHDSTGACKVLPTDIRVVCWNTWHAADAQGDRTGHQVVIRHIGDTAAKVELAKQAIAATREASKAWQMEAADLASINVTDAMVATFLDQFIPVPENASAVTRRQREERRAIFHAVLNGPTVGETLGHTAYGLVQAAGEYLDHLRPYRNADTYLARTLFSPEPIKTGVLQLVREVASDSDLATRSISIPDTIESLLN